MSMRKIEPLQQDLPKQNAFFFDFLSMPINFNTHGTIKEFKTEGILT
jgi:hypothetical protein